MDKYQTGCEGFHSAGKGDLKAAERLLQCGLHGEAAYHMQQALEKHIKAAVCYRANYKNAARLKHILFPKMLRNLAELVKGSEYSGSELGLNTVIGFFDDLAKHRVAFWKWSLGTELNGDERRRIEQFVSEHNPKSSKYDPIRRELDLARHERRLFGKPKGDIWRADVGVSQSGTQKVRLQENHRRMRIYTRPTHHAINPT